MLPRQKPPAVSDTALDVYKRQEQKIIVREKEIVICNFFGKRRTIDRQEIGQITSDQNHVRYGFMNKQNQQLFAVSVNMVDAVAFIQDTLDELEKR